ncbi:MAG TPA: 3'-5' exonuclease [Candidatus Desulfovibrio intestinipullorum]|uniref:3'-5' exonuclease n=1 Tax=Candidatus Desulfovibrio intestinipullorum TaxID=2838536 RepID=A0A9D1PWK8_9BACT|nr:3'-5' exonuclease [Candidatus Desulfovibrio intestinipullorum]
MIIEPMKPSSDQLQQKTVYVVKVETTGLAMDDEILELCVIDARNPWKQGERGREAVPLFHSRFRPEYKIEWPRASRINGITPRTVARAPFLNDFREELGRLFIRCDCLVCFNAEFDFSFLRRQFLFKARLMTVDLMRDWTEYRTGAAVKDGTEFRMPFLTQKDLFSHFNWPVNTGSPISDCLGLRHCFLQLIPTGCIHIRRPLQERRFSRISEMQLLEVREAFDRKAASLGAGPYLRMDPRDNDLLVRLGIEDPDHIYYAGEAPSLSLRVPATGSASEVRERVAQALEAESGLPEGLVILATDALRETDTLKDRSQKRREQLVSGSTREQTKASKKDVPQKDASADASQDSPRDNTPRNTLTNATTERLTAGQQGAQAGSQPDGQNTPSA